MRRSPCCSTQHFRALRRFRLRPRDMAKRVAKRHCGDGGDCSTIPCKNSGTSDAEPCDKRHRAVRIERCRGNRVKSLNGPVVSATKVNVYPASALAVPATIAHTTRKAQCSRDRKARSIIELLFRFTQHFRVVRRARLSPSESARSNEGEGSGTGLAMAMPVVPFASP